MRQRDLIGAMAACGLLAACGSEPRTPPYRYKLKVEVETPEGIRTGESAIQVQWWQGGKEAFGSQASAGYKIVGEAVAVDLPRAQTLFVLLRSPSNPDWAAWAFEGIADDVKDPQSAGGIAHAISDAEESSGGSGYPYFVRFDDLADPETVREVNPNNLEASFGRGTRLRKVTVQITQDPVSERIVARLPWLQKLKGALMDPSNFRDTPTGRPLPFAVSVTARDFARGGAQ